MALTDSVIHHVVKVLLLLRRLLVIRSPVAERPPLAMELVEICLLIMPFRNKRIELKQQKKYIASRKS
jgi:hypothetical protein